MRIRQLGFTMIELIVVIVILGILAATALPKFIDLSGDAHAAALKGVNGAAASAMLINYSGCAATNQVVTASKCVKISNCSQIGTIMQGGFPTGDYSIAAAALGTGAAGSNGVEATCTITELADNTKTASFTGVSAGN